MKKVLIQHSALMLKKKIIMTVLFAAACACLFLPFVNVMQQGVSYNGWELMFNRSFTFAVKSLGGGGQAELITSLLAPILVFISLVGALLTAWLDKRKNNGFRILCGIFVSAAAIGVLLSVLLLKTDNDTITLKMGAGTLLAVICLLFYFIYAVSDRSTPLFEVNIYIVLALLGVVLLYPYINTLALSLDNSGESISVFPRQFTWNNFMYVLNNPKFFKGVWVTVTRTVIGSVTALLCTLIFSYGLSKPHLIGRGLFMKLCVFTMYFSGGLIPSFILFGKLGLVNNYLVYIVPNLINVFNMILAVNYFKGIPPSLEESAKIDGANDFQVLFRVMIPVSAPIVAVIGLFNAVFQWNSWYDAYLYMSGRADLKPLQNVLIDIVNESQISKFLTDVPISIKDILGEPVSQSIVAAAIILTIGPIILLYPLLQRYFVKGMMLGSVKE